KLIQRIQGDLSSRGSRRTKSKRHSRSRARRDSPDIRRLCCYDSQHQFITKAESCGATEIGNSSTNPRTAFLVQMPARAKKSLKPSISRSDGVQRIAP